MSKSCTCYNKDARQWWKFFLVQKFYGSIVCYSYFLLWLWVVSKASLIMSSWFDSNVDWKRFLDTTRIRQRELQKLHDKLYLKTHEMAREVHYAKRRFPVELWPQVPNRSGTIDCWICEELFGREDKTIQDQCHHCKNVLGSAHEICNWIRRTTSFTPVIGPNIANYDLQHVC